VPSSVRRRPPAPPLLPDPPPAQLGAEVAHHVTEAGAGGGLPGHVALGVASRPLDRAALGERDLAVVAVDVDDLGPDLLLDRVVALPVVTLVASSDRWTRPSTPSSISTNTPKSARWTTGPSIT
jgi:hypothetical protein